MQQKPTITFECQTLDQVPLQREGFPSRQANHEKSCQMVGNIKTAGLKNQISNVTCSFVTISPVQSCTEAPFHTCSYSRKVFSICFLLEDSFILAAGVSAQSPHHGSELEVFACRHPMRARSCQIRAYLLALFLTSLDTLIPFIIILHPFDNYSTLQALTMSCLKIQPGSLAEQGTINGDANPVREPFKNIPFQSNLCQLMPNVIRHLAEPPTYFVSCLLKFLAVFPRTFLNSMSSAEFHQLIVHSDFL